MRTIENLVRDKKLVEEKIAVIMADLYKKYPEFDITLNYRFRDVVRNCFGKIEALSSESIINVAV